MTLRDVIRSIRTSLGGGWSPAGTVAIAVVLVGGLMGLGVLHVYLKSLGIVLTPAAEHSILVRVGPEHIVRARGIVARPGDVQRLRGLFAELGYDPSRHDGGRFEVPRLFVSAMPRDLEAVRPVTERKRLFIHAILPQVLLINEIIGQSRRRLLSLKDRIEAGTVGWSDSLWLAGLYERYRVEEDDLDELIRRVDTVPVSLALAQAAIESGWGTSRFAREGNAMFGQWTWARRGGLVPTERDAGATHTVRSFHQIADSVSAYVRNLNTHSAYDRFRRARAATRAAGGQPDAITLSAKLDRYSQRGKAYVKDIRGIIKRNRLRRFADAVLMTRTCRATDAEVAAPRGILVRVPPC